MYIMFLDESGDHSLAKVDSQYPVFCLCGVIVNQAIYKDKISPDLDKIKLKYWKTTDVIFHSRDIRKCNPPFDNLLEEKTRQSFYQDLNNFFTQAPITIIASVILKNQLKNQYTDPSDPYALSMIFLMERFLYFLEEKKDRGFLTVESRDQRANNRLFSQYSKILNEGSGRLYCIVPSRFQSRILKIEFVTKKQNENGHQLADLAAYPIANYGLYPKRKNLAYNVLKPKIRQRGGRVKGCGLKVFP